MRAFLIVAALLLPVAASAHAFGQSFTLPLPISFYVVAAAAALIASFAILSLWSRPHTEEARENVRTYPLGGIGKILQITLRVIGLVLFALTIIVAIVGPSDYSKNLAVPMFWIALLLVFTYGSALVGGLWKLLNPAETICVLLLGNDYAGLVRLPKSARFLPAIVVYLVILWLELLSYGLGAIPSTLGSFILGYLVLSFIGALLVGVEEWFTYGDFFGVFFSMVSRFAPVQLEKESIVFTYPGERLVVERASSWWELIFILLVLASTAYDGIKDTQPWIDALSSANFLINHYNAIGYVGLIVAPLTTLVLYVIATWLMSAFSGVKPLFSVLMRFAYSLVPIAVAYNFAHYFGLILTEGQRLIVQISDPLARGWDLFGTASYHVRPTIIGAASIWYLQAGAILVGHIIATYVAHRIALTTLPTRRAVVIAQLPILALMVCYTAIGLWILSLPYAIGA